MKTRFSSRELFDLRNNIPVDMLIKDHRCVIFKK